MDGLLDKLSASHYGDLASVVGLGISLVGFVVTIFNVTRAKNAAAKAEQAASATRKAIYFFDTILDFTQAIHTLEEIKRLHRTGEWKLLLDRYALTRKFLLNLRKSEELLSDEHQSVLQNALTNLREIETKVERKLSEDAPINTARFNSALSVDIDGLIEVLAEVKATRMARDGKA